MYGRAHAQVFVSKLCIVKQQCAAKMGEGAQRFVKKFCSPPALRSDTWNIFFNWQLIAVRTCKPYVYSEDNLIGALCNFYCTHSDISDALWPRPQWVKVPFPG